MLPQTMGSETNIKLPFSFIFFSLVSLIGSQILLLLNGEVMIGGVFRLPPIWAAAHLLILGWLLMVAMGAMYQLVPVAFLTPIWNETFGFIQFFITAFGIAWFTGALFFNPQTAFYPGAITLLGILLFIIQMFLTLRKQAKPNVMTLFVGTGLLSLLATISIGLYLVYSLYSGNSSELYQPLFKTHLLLGLAGWFTFLIFGFSYKMAPMFALAHGYSMKPALFVYSFYVLGLIISIISFFIDSQILFTVALFVLLIGFSLFTYHIRLIYKKRMKKKVDKPFLFALIAVPIGNVIYFIAFLSSAFGAFSIMGGVIIYLHLFLWIMLSILGYLYKIVPFLWWTHKYSKEIGKKAVPTLKEMMNEKIVVPLFLSYIISTVIVAIGILFSQSLLFLIGQSLLLVAVIVYCSVVFQVIRK